MSAKPNSDHEERPLARAPAAKIEDFLQMYKTASFTRAESHTEAQLRYSQSCK